MLSLRTSVFVRLRDFQYIFAVTYETLLGVSEVTANLYCKCVYLYWEGCVYIFAVIYETLCSDLVAALSVPGILAAVLVVFALEVLTPLQPPSVPIPLSNMQMKILISEAVFYNLLCP